MKWEYINQLSFQARYFCTNKTTTHLPTNMKLATISRETQGTHQSGIPASQIFLNIYHHSN